MEVKVNLNVVKKLEAAEKSIYEKAKELHKATVDLYSTLGDMSIEVNDNNTVKELQGKIADRDQLIRKLQLMNQNAAEQAVAGYKAELSSAVKSIVEDAQLPEARTDPEIANALLWDMLDVLRYKGII